ncbi:MAG: aminomethyl-transferring glycine dehydrogenase subunit GcvPA [Thermoguttaceae bacterium]|jgi:glycine dehydrogenase subunit 1|nr:aminomethyl-transferring glycine dehydrogenase subunit GcvPA [Thermoguttaceae bacterium]
MPYLPNTISDQQAMLDAIGVSSTDELFAMIPDALRLKRPLDLPPGMGELELTRHMTALAARNLPAGQSAGFLGGGSYDHFIPAVVDVIASRSEFYTAYTPYQPEASQGTLQAMFEYQTLITQLTGMDVSNASMYDGASAAVEAVLMALSATRRKRVAVARSVHPETRQVLETYLTNLDVAIDLVDVPEGAVVPDDAQRAVTEQTACLLVQQPNFFGCLEPMDELSRIAHAQGALLVTVVDPISLGLLKRPGEYGADLVAAEGQSLGCPMGFGGPYLGILACSEKFVRRMPGRLVGETTDRRGKRCYVLTLQTREQHIRREKATSNICTNQGLLALRASVYLALMGPQGMRQVAELCLQKTRYALEQLTAGGVLKPAFNRPVLKEFTLRAAGENAAKVVEKALAEGMLVGPSLGRWYPELDGCLLVAVTEKRTRDDIDRLASLLA